MIVQRLIASKERAINSMIGAKGNVLVEGEPNSYTAADYVQDGLLVLLDGIENVGWGVQDKESTIWVDLISGEEHAVGNQTFEDDGLMWINTSTLTLKPSQILGEDFFFSDKTIELCGETNPTAYDNVGLRGQKLFGFTQPGYGSAPNRYRSTLIDCYDIRSWTFLVTYEQDGFFKPIKHRTSLVLHNSYLQPYYNGEPKLYNRKATIPTYTSGFTSFIWAGTAGCKLRCIRIYNRALSAEEIAYNHLIDLERFGL